MVNNNSYDDTNPTKTIPAELTTTTVPKANDIISRRGPASRTGGHIQRAALHFGPIASTNDE
eukprot:scaffold298650_cov19-Prasinocladus_malaysianus.AAC.1